MKLNLRKIQVSHYIAIKSLSVLKKKHPSGSLYGFVAKVVTAAVLFLGALAFFWQRIDFFRRDGTSFKSLHKLKSQHN